jgi:phosphopantetheinyl transferase (holo-ACP synthase)
VIAAAGVGVDLVEIDRIERLIAERGAHVFERLLTPAERA